jgi:exodeoxyribonuclease III
VAQTGADERRRLMRIATFNVNGIGARLPRLVEWLGAFSPDVVGLQEIKCQDENFPRLEIEALGYHVHTHGQKGFNGVAILSKTPVSEVIRGLPGDDSDEQSRWIEGTVNGIRIGVLYLPNGNPQPGPKFDYKLSWMRRLIAHAKQLLASETPLALIGDYNVCPHDIDCYDPRAMADDALLRSESRALFRELLSLGFSDALRAQQPDGRFYTYWDYQAGAWAKDNGLRIDHLLLSPEAADRFISAGVDRKPRAAEKASDHTPAWVELAA